jgi:hypothetical protein
VGVGGVVGGWVGGWVGGGQHKLSCDMLIWRSTRPQSPIELIGQVAEYAI